MITKGQAIGGGVIILGSGATVGSILGTQDSEYEDSEKLVLLAYESDFLNNYAEGTIGRKYGWYLTSAHGKRFEKGKDSVNNKKWWKLRYFVWKSLSESGRSKLSNEFKNKDRIKLAFSSSKDSGSDASKALNKVCESIYKKQASTVEFKFTTDSEESKLGDDMLTYCSPFTSIPKTIQQTMKGSGYGSGTWGDTYKDKLVSISNYETQEYFWPLRDAEFFGKENEDGTGAGLTEADDKLFHELYSKKSTREQEDTVMKTCEKVYKSSKTGSEIKIKEETLFKFCSWDYKIDSTG